MRRGGSDGSWIALGTPARPGDHPCGVDVFSALRRWQDFLTVQGHADRTREQYTYWVLKFLSRTLMDLRSVTEDDVVAYLAARPRQGHEVPQTLRALKSFFHWAEDREVLVDPTRRLKVREPKQGPAPYLEVSTELVRLTIAAAWHEPADPRRPWALLFAYATALRVGSLCSVMPEDVRSDEVIVHKAKGDRPYRVKLGPTGRAAADELLGLLSWKPENVRRRPPTLIGVGPGRFRQWVRDAQLATGIRAWPHLLRHTAATEMYSRTKDPMVVKTFLNHSDLSQIHRYVGVNDERMREVAI